MQRNRFPDTASIKYLGRLVGIAFKNKSEEERPYKFFCLFNTVSARDLFASFAQT